MKDSLRKQSFSESDKLSRYTVLIIVLLCSVLCIYYTFSKAYFNSFTHDESLSYNNYVNTPWLNIIFYRGAQNPNNHILNTLLMKLFQVFFGSSEFALRLPNLSAYLLFIYFSIKWLLKPKNYFLLAVGFCIIHLNPYMLDFFALARGYGLSMCFMFISFYYYQQFIDSEKQKDNLYSFSAAALAVYSNFTLLNFYFAILLIFNINLILHNREWLTDYRSLFMNLWKANKIPLWVTAILFVLIIIPLITISGGLFGPQDSFFSGTIGSLWTSLTLGNKFNLVTLLSVFTILTEVVLLIFISYEWFYGKKEWAKNLFIIFLFSFLPALVSIMQHLFTGSPYLAYRTAIFFIILFNVTLILLLHYINNKWKKNWLTLLVAIPYTLFIIYNFYEHYQLNYYYEWQYEAHTKEILKKVKADAQPRIDKNEQISIGVTWLFEPTLTYYKTTQQLNWLKELNREDYKSTYDYYYVWNDEKFIKENNYTVLNSYPEILTTFAKNTKAEVPANKQ